MKFNSVLQGGAKLGDETSRSEKIGVVQSSGTDFKQTLFFLKKSGNFGNFGWVGKIVWPGCNGWPLYFYQCQ